MGPIAAHDRRRHSHGRGAAAGGGQPGLQVFVSFLRIAGAALTALFTAIVTQYLLRARLGGALERSTASRTPGTSSSVDWAMLATASSRSC